MDMASLARFSVNVYEAGGTVNVFGVVLVVDDDWDLERAIGVYEVAMKDVKSCL